MRRSTQKKMDNIVEDSLKLRYTPASEHSIRIRGKDRAVLGIMQGRSPHERSPWDPTFEERNEKLHVVGGRFPAKASVEMGKKFTQTSRNILGQ